MAELKQQNSKDPADWPNALGAIFKKLQSDGKLEIEEAHDVVVCFRNINLFYKTADNVAAENVKLRAEILKLNNSTNNNFEKTKTLKIEELTNDTC